MTYIEILNEFEAWSELHPLSAGAQALWFRLLGMFNRAFWPPEVTVRREHLMALCGLGRKAFCNAARELSQSGLVEYDPGGGSLCVFRLTGALERRRQSCRPRAGRQAAPACSPAFDVDAVARRMMDETPTL